MSVWTEKDVKKLEQMLLDGCSAQIIATELGRSRSAVCAKMMRIREAKGQTATRPVPHISAKSSNPRSRPTVRKSDKVAVVPVARDVTVELPKSQAASLRIPLLKTKDRHCRWIDAEPGSDGLPTCCGHKVPATPGLMFCSYHRNRARGEGTVSERRALSGFDRKTRKDAA